MTPAPVSRHEFAPGTGTGRSWMLAGIVFGVLAAASSAVQSAEAAASSQAQRQYDVPAGALDGALKTFASQSGVMLSVDAGLTTGKSSSGLKGNYTVVQGFTSLLAGSGLQAVERPQGGYSVTALPARDNASAAAGQLAAAQTMGRIKVESELDPDGSVEQGYRSDTVSAVGPWQGRSLQDTPYSITVIPQDLIENLQATTPDQIYRVAPTVHFVRPQYENDQAGVFMRGFYVFTPLRNGLPSNASGMGASIEDIERVEIFTGLSGFLYGPGNVGGMINYVTKRPTPEHLHRVTIGNNGGSNYYAQADLGGPIDSDGRFGYRVNGAWQDGETAIENLDIEKRFISAAFDWQVTDSLLWQFDASYRHFEVQGDQPLWFLGAGASRPSANDLDAEVSWGQPWSEEWFKSQRYSTQLRWEASETVTLRAAGQYSNLRRSYNQAFNTIEADGTYSQYISGHYAPGDNEQDVDMSDQSAQLFADISFATGGVAHKLTTGVQYQEYGDETFTNYTAGIAYSGLPLNRPTYFDEPVPEHVDRGPRIRSGDRSYKALLIGDDVSFNEQWSLLAGVAHTTIKVDAGPRSAGYEESAVSPNVSVIYKPIEAVTTYASYIEALEQGGVAGDDYNGVPVINRRAVMEPLISEQIEIGAKWSLGGMLLTTALFQIDKALEYYDLRTPDAPRYVQDGRQVHRGLELTAFGKLTDDLTLTGGFTVLDAKVKEQQENPALEGKRPPYVAKTFAKLRLEYRLPSLPALSLSSAVSYTDDLYADPMNTDRIASYALLDVGARYETQLAQRPLTLRLDVNNVGDKAYWSQQGLSLGLPRIVLLSASAEF